MKPRILWVVEMKIDGNWWPTVGVKLDRADGRQELKIWKRNYADKFRLWPYTPR